jgi:hypothetical protein
MAPIIPIATIGSIVGLEPLEIAVHRRRHLIFDDFLQGLPTKGAITLASKPSVCIAFTISNAIGRTRDRRSSL